MQGARTDNLWYEPNGDVTEPAKDGSLSVLVNTSNCVGAMGAGVAKRFAERYPILLPDFREACRNGAFKPGRPRFHHVTDDISVMHIPTKDDWRNGSRYSWVAGGLLLAGKMAENLAIDRGRKVTLRIPPAGCGNGGLDWQVVSRLVRGLLPGGETVRVILCGMSGEAARSAGQRRNKAPIIAGIGSRDAPDEVLARIRRISKAVSQIGWGVRSGDADGCDAAFRDGHFAAEGGKVGSYIGYLSSPNKREKGPGAEFHELEPWVYAAGGLFHDDPGRVGLTRDGKRVAIGQKADASAALISRNTYQILGHDGVDPSDAVLCWTPHGSGSGGTGQAIRIARHVGIPVVDLGETRFAQMPDADLVRFVFERMRERESVLSRVLEPVSSAPDFMPRRMSEPPAPVEAGEIDFFPGISEQREGLISDDDARRLAADFSDPESRERAVRDLMSLSGESSYGSLARLIGARVSDMARAVHAIRSEGAEP